MTVFNGKSVYGAIVSGNVCILKKPVLSAGRVTTEDTATEIHRFEAAKYVASRQLQEIYERAIDEIGEPNAQIFGIHMMMLEDEDYCGSITGIIEAESVNAEYAVAQTSDIFAQMLEAMDNEYMCARSADVRDVSNRLISILTGTSMDIGNIPENSVICADDLTPSEAAALERKKAAAFVTAHGSAISHTAILAHSMNIPAIIGTGDDFLSRIHEGEEVIVDGFTGQVILSPDKSAKRRLTEKRRAKTSPGRGTQTRTLDGKRVTLLSSGAISDIPEFADGAAAMDCRIIPDEQKQYEYYRDIAEISEYRKSVIRMPAISLSDPDRHSKYRSQLRAVFKACSHGKPSILFPMITSVQEARKIMAACDDIKKELRSEGYDCTENSKIGFMLETPAAAIISDILAPMSDLFIIDSDRLARCTLASYGGSIYSEEFAEGQKAAVMRLISFSTINAVRNGAKIGICGFLAEDASLTGEFLRMGIDKFIIPAEKLPDIRKAVMETNLDS